MFEDLDYEKVEVFVGDSKSKEYREKLIGKPEIADKLESLKEDGKLKIYTIGEKSRSTVHTKQYILESKDRDVKVIYGSPNFTKNGWGGNQKNMIVFIEGDKDNELYRKSLELYKDQIDSYGELFLKDLTKTIKERGGDRERKDVIEEWLEGKKSTEDGKKEIHKKIIESIDDKKEPEKIKISMLGHDNRDIDYIESETKDFGAHISDKNLEIPTSGVNRLYRERYEVPIMKTEENELIFLTKNGPINIAKKPPKSPDKINAALHKFERYFVLVDKYAQTHDLVGVKSHMFEALLFFFWAPFSHLQAKYYKNNHLENMTKSIPFLYIFGESNAGKGTLAKYGLQLISKNTVVDYMEADEMSKRALRRLKTINTCFPPVIDDIDKSKLKKDILSNYWDQWDYDSLLPNLIFTSNDGKPKKWFRNRAKILHLDVMFEENKEREKKVSKLIKEYNPLFEWFSYLYLKIPDDKLYCDKNNELENDVLAPARKVLKLLYDRANRDIPNYFPETPAEKLFDKGKEDWIKAYEDGSISHLDRKSDRLIVYFDLSGHEVYRFKKNLPNDIRADKKGNRIEINSKEKFINWIGQENLKDTGITGKFRRMMRWKSQT